MVRARILMIVGAVLALGAILVAAVSPGATFDAWMVELGVLLVLGAGVGLFSAGLFRERLIQRVNALGARASAIARGGDLTERLAPEVRGELDELTRSFNELLDAAEASRREIDAVSNNFRELFEASPFPAVVSRMDPPAVLAVNRSAIERFGVPPDQVTGAQPRSYYVDPSQRDALVARVRRGERVTEELIHLRSARGDTFWALASASQVQFEGAPAMIIAFNDVSDRIGAEERLRASQERLSRQSATLTELTAGTAGGPRALSSELRRILQHAAQTVEVERASIWRLEDEGQAIRSLGLYRRSQNDCFSGDRLARSVAPAYFAAIEHEKLIAAEDALSDARTREFADGYLRPYGIGAMLDVPLRVDERTVGVLCLEHAGGPRAWTVDEQNFALSVANLVVVALSDAERRAALQSLAQSEERARTILATAHDAFIGMDSHGRIVSWNAQAERTFGWTTEEAVGRQVAETIIPHDMRDAHRRGLAHFLETGAAPIVNRRLEVMALHRDGHAFPIEITVTSPIPAGSEFFFGAFLRDITERRRHESELRTARDAAEAATRAKSEFLANMSHELRTPLNGVLGYTQLLQRERNLSDGQRRSLEAIARSGMHLLELINDVLDLSKIEAGRIELDVRPTSLPQLVVDLRHVVSEPARRKGLKLALAIAPDVPRHVQLDGRHVRQVLLNLLGNAIKFTAQGEVRLDVAADGGRLRFDVVDTGAGIEPENLGIVFEAFRQTKTGAAAGGTGLGLTISRRLVEAMGGVLRVESAVGRGSRFHFDVPLVPAAIEPGTAENEAFECDLRLAPGQSAAALVVDDGSVNRRILASLLESAGIRAITAEDGAEAVALARTHRPDVVLMDLRMPVLDGFEATRRLKGSPDTAAIPVIAVSASALEDSRGRAAEAGCIDFVSKPVQAGELFEKLHRHLGLAFVHGPVGPPSEPALPVLDPARAGDIAARLRAAVELGSIRDLETLARDLDAEGGDVAAVARRIAALASAFDFDGLGALAASLAARPEGTLR